MMNPRCKYLIVISGVLQNIYEDVCIQVQELVDNQLKCLPKGRHAKASQASHNLWS
jgi:hypothetical protein